MPLTTINGDMLTIERGIICHQVNCMGKMGAGIALKIRKKWPGVYKDYMSVYHAQQLALGVVTLSVIVPGQLYVANLCGQLHYGRNRQYTDYTAVSQCLTKVNTIASKLKLPVYIPNGMGCSLAGGDWNIMSGMIYGTLPNAIIMNYD